MAAVTPLTRGEVAPEKTRCRELCQPQPQSAALLASHCYSEHSYHTVYTLQPVEGRLFQIYSITYYVKNEVIGHT